jgi:vitamin K-dependent gamma-carboxylase
MNQHASGPLEPIHRPTELQQWLRAPCDIAAVAFFRAAFALTILVHIYLYFSNGLIEYYFGAPEYHLSYFGFEWVEAFSLDGMRRVYYLMALAAVGVGLGLCYRISTIVLFVTFTFTFLAEAAQFQNHYYLISLVSFLLVFIPAHRSFSIDAILVPDKASSVIPNWCRLMLIFQLSVPYVYGGLVKLNSDWLHGLPVGMWISEKSDLALIGPWLTERSTAWFISYVGLFLDLFIVPLLLWKPTRIWAFTIVTLFHLFNSILFSIDVFPWMMILTTPIFFSPGWPRRFLRLDAPSTESSSNTSHSRPARTYRVTFAFFTVYIIWQLAFPFRHVMYPGEPAWTEEGQQFAWRMMLRRKDVFFRVYATDRLTGTTLEVPVSRLMTSRQIMELAVSPAQIVACAPFFAAKAEEAGMSDVEIRAFVLTSLNGRKPQLQMDQNQDLLKMTRTIWPQQGITPLTEPRRIPVWDIPSDQWPDLLRIEIPAVTTAPRPTQ